MMDTYLDSAIRRLLAEDPRLCEQAVRVKLRDDRIVLYGEVESEERRLMIEFVVREAFPEVNVDNDLGIVRNAPPPLEAEDLT
ncbi:BON domain-containing protein [Longispora albida]|uniref:BON domain-containing protein n=1 Tax=Longispora albida TaxID=203523 RepID=UPI0003A10F27|nr:BON domain-containing protein [Longispora albida]